MTLTLPRGLPSPETPVTVPLKVSISFGAVGDGQADGAERGRGARRGSLFTVKSGPAEAEPV